MTRSIMILGRQPGLGRAELESVYGAGSVEPLGSGSVILNVPADQVKLERLGGTIKVGKLLDTLPSTDWRRVTSYLVEHVPKHTCCFGPGKLTFGLSAYGFKTSPKAINATALEVKKAVRATDRPVRVVPNKTHELNSAQVLHNHMTDLPFGMELLLIAHQGQTYLAQTVAVQDIEAYGARDQARPKRDARVGMLPPKLAQIIVNLATGRPEKPDLTVLDPFCGTGVIMQEALLMGHNTYGSDLEPRMVQYSLENLMWLEEKHKLAPFKLEIADATAHEWQALRFHAVATETYLGRPFSASHAAVVLHQVRHDVDIIHKKFLRNLARQTKPGFRLCLAVPAWHTKRGFQHLKTLDSLKELGYTRINFVHAPREELIYHRPGQIVGRELVVLERN